MTVVFDIVEKVTPDDFAQIPLVDLSLLGSDIVFLGVDAVLDNCSMLVLIVNVVNFSPIESWIGLVMELGMEPVMESVIGSAIGSVIRLVMKLGIWIRFSLIRPAMTLVIGPVMTPETKLVIGPEMGHAM